ncbi:MAG: ribonuclease HII [Magnetococcales bacterium]|nr:ribonuclease HII [Magnetococcales bacterium]
MAADPTRGPDFRWETPLWTQGLVRVAGVDEVGRGPLAGPVVAVAVILPPGWAPVGLDDSKRLTPQQREALAEVLCANAVDWGLGSAEPDEIDRINIRRATLAAMARAVAKLQSAPQYLLVDGRDLPDPLPCPARAVVKGDATSVAIAAASVLAKVARDALMRDLADRYPGYGWEHNMGYPTAQHRQALRERGVTPCHRRSFGPVRQALEML